MGTFNAKAYMLLLNKMQAHKHGICSVGGKGREAGITEGQVRYYTDEWIVSRVDLYAYGGLERVYEEGERSTDIYHQEGEQWHILLYNINDSVKLIPTGRAGEYDDIEYTSIYRTTDEGYKGRRRPFVLRFRWIDQKYRVCQCRDAHSGEIVPCASLRFQGSRTLADQRFVLSENCR